MNMLLDINALVRKDKHIEKHTLSTFEGVLRHVHDLIKRYNHEQVKQMNYTVPKYVFGKPMYDVHVLANFLCHHLQDNGLYVKRVSPVELYISWNDKDINIDRFVNRKSQIDREGKNIHVGQAARPANPIDVLRFRQERQKQLHRQT